MLSRKRQRRLRKIRYLEQRKKDDEIRLLRLSVINQRNAKHRSIEAIIDSVWPEHHTKEAEQEKDIVNLLVAFKNAMSKYPTDSINNRCFPKMYLQKVKNRYPRRRSCSSESRN